LEAQPNQRPRHELLVRMASWEGVHGRSQSQKEGGGLRFFESPTVAQSVSNYLGVSLGLASSYTDFVVADLSIGDLFDRPHAAGGFVICSVKTR
jgi:hypothetical protein